MCNVDVEYLLHLFFDCQFASSCWLSVGLIYDMREVQSAPEWLFNKLEMAKHDEIITACIILWGIWFLRNKKVRQEQQLKPSHSYGTRSKDL